MLDWLAGEERLLCLNPGEEEEKEGQLDYQTLSHLQSVSQTGITSSSVRTSVSSWFFRTFSMMLRASRISPSDSSARTGSLSVSSMVWWWWSWCSIGGPDLRTWYRNVSSSPSLPLPLKHDVSTVAVTEPPLQLIIVINTTHLTFSLTWKPLERQKLSHWPGSMKALLRWPAWDTSDSPPHMRLKHRRIQDLGGSQVIMI